MDDINSKKISPESYFEYKGKPLVRQENTICYGDMDEKYILLLTIMNNKKIGETEVPDKVLVQIMNTDTSLPDHSRIEKQDMKSGLFEAFDLGRIWLNRMLESEKK